MLTKKITFSIPFCILITHVLSVKSHEIEYALGVIERVEAFSGSQGWARELLRTHLAIPRDVLVTLYGAMSLVPALSITAKVEGTPIGQRNCTFIKNWLDELQKGVEAVGQKYTEENIRKYLITCQKTLDVEIQLLQELCNKGIRPENVVHNSGLMVLKDYEGQGIGNVLQQKSLILLQEQGIKVVIGETTNKKSARIMEKQGFTMYAKFSYQDDFNIDGLDDSYTIWYIEL